MEAPMNQIRELYAQANASERHRLQDQIRDLQNELYTEWDIMFGLAMGPLQWTLAQIGIDLNIFTTLVSSPSTVNHQDFVTKTGAAPKFLKHFLRTLASFGLIEEVAQDSFQANRITRTFAGPHVAGAAPNISGVQFPVAMALPKYLKEHGYQDMTDIKDLPFQKALGTDLAPFDFLKQSPEQMKALGHVMVLDAVQSWIESYPVEEQLGDFKPTSESAVLVDIGGGFGQHSVAFKEKYPQLTGRVVVQDLPSTLMHLPATKPERIEFVEYDFFTPQPIKGAKFYYLRHILHDWPDIDCVRILQQIIPATSAGSLILIDEVVLPDTKVPWQVSGMVLSMMACLGGTERSKEDWEILLDQAGLKIMHIHQYDPVKFHSVVAAVPK